MLRKVLSNIHWLIGISVGIVLAIVGVTGAMMSFRDEILSLLNGRPGHVQVARPAMTPDEIVAKALAANPGRSLSRLTFSDDPEQAVKVEYAWPNGARPRPGEDDGSRYFNQYTGAMNSTKTERGSDFFAALERIHRRLAFTTTSNGSPGAAPKPPAAATAGAAPNTVPVKPRGEPPASLGTMVTSYSVLGLLIMALSGLYLRWPRRKASEWRSWLKINFKLKGFPFNYNLHAVTGTLALLGFLLTAHSGLMMSQLHWYNNPINAAAGVKEEPKGGALTANDHPYQFNMLWAAFTREVPAFKRAVLQLSRSNADEVQVTYVLHTPSDFQSGRDINTLVLDAHTGAIKRHELFADKSALQQVVVRNFDVHSGNIFGLPGRLLMTFTSLLMPVLLVTGWLQYLARRKLKKQRAAALRAAGS